jgi:hypothetical protein
MGEGGSIAGEERRTGAEEMPGEMVTVHSAGVPAPKVWTVEPSGEVVTLSVVTGMAAAEVAGASSVKASTPGGVNATGAGKVMGTISWANRVSAQNDPSEQVAHKVIMAMSLCRMARFRAPEGHDSWVGK